MLGKVWRVSLYQACLTKLGLWKGERELGFSVYQLLNISAISEASLPQMKKSRFSTLHQPG